MYADKITASMQKQLTKPITEEQSKLILIQQTGSSSTEQKKESAFTKNPLDYELGLTLDTAAESETEYLSKAEIEKRIREKRKAMEKAAKDLDFMQAAKLRDDIKNYKDS
jgi:excinuclease ABC subunit B